jgi:signal transduction histidine kinase
MIPVSQMASWYGRWAGTAREALGFRQAQAVAGSSLALLGLIEALTRAVIRGSDATSALVLALLALGTTVPLAVFGPAAAAFTACAATLLSLAGFHTLSVAGFVALLVTLYQAGRATPEPGLVRLSAVGLAVPFAVLALTGPRPTSSEAAALTVLLAALAPVASLGGIAQQARHEAEENRAARQVIADTLIEHTARGERARIARELHDVVAHYISMVAVQAESARLGVPGLPAAGAQRLLAIGDTARAALVEMRRLLGVLRADARIEVADRHPQPGLDQLNKLIDEAREASGSATRLILRGPPISLDPGVELVAYRIVQEGLTNARRHAPGAAVDVELTFCDDSLLLRVRDNGPGPESAAAGGHGVAGMHERASAVGGKVRTGPALGGGYLVEATLPARIEAPA